MPANRLRRVVRGSALQTGSPPGGQPARPRDSLRRSKARALGTAVTAAATEMDVNLAWARIFYVYGPSGFPITPSAESCARPWRADGPRPGRRSIATSSTCTTVPRLHSPHWADMVRTGRSTSVPPGPLRCGEIESLVRGILDDYAMCRRSPWRTTIICHRSGDASALTAFGWQPQVDLRSGLAQTIASWREAKNKPALGGEES